MQQVQSAGQPKRKRKGISVSLTPEKRGEQVPQMVSPKLDLIRLDQSYARFDQQPVYPPYVRVFSSIKPAEIPVRFSYSNVSKEHQIKQSQALNQEIYSLKRQIERKRQVVDFLQQKQGLMSTSNVRPVYALQPPPVTANYHKSARCAQPVQPYRQQTPPQAVSNVWERKQIQQTKTVIQDQNKKTAINPFPVLEEPANNYNVQKIENAQNSVRQDFNQKVIKPIGQIPKYEEEKPIISTHVKRSQQKLAKVQLNVEIRKSPQKMSAIQRRTEDKQNETRQSERLQRLRWAEQKLLDIIKVCDRGL